MVQKRLLQALYYTYIAIVEKNRKISLLYCYRNTFVKAVGTAITSCRQSSDSSWRKTSNTMYQQPQGNQSHSFWVHSVVVSARHPSNWIVGRGYHTSKQEKIAPREHRDHLARLSREFETKKNPSSSFKFKFQVQVSSPSSCEHRNHNFS